VHEIAQAGLGVSTASIAKGADLAEGTMFTYFASKNELLNELYVDLKTETYRLIYLDFPHQASLRERAQHIWTEYLRWAMEHPDERKVSVLLNLSPIISAATRDRVNEQRGAVAQAMEELGQRGVFKDLPPGFAASSMLAMQEAVMEMLAKKPRQKANLVEHGFNAFWRMAK
jgi:AcrR family transcriptional regulator